MTDHKEISKNSYDFAIVGSHFSALLVAYILSRTFHKKVAIIEPQDFVGGEDATIKIDNKKLLSHFSKVSASEQNLDLLHWLATNIEIDIPSDAFEFTPLTIESGKLIPFVGFGERKFSTIELFKDFSSSKNYELSSNLDAWTEHLESCFIGDIYTMAEVTSIEVENGQIKYVAINGSRNLICENLVYCLPPKSIKKLLPIDVVSHKSFQRLLKNKSYSQVRLHLLHDQDVIVEKNPFHILYGGKDDFEPIVGQFSEINSHLCSLWTCWMLTDLIDDHEHLGALLKNIKKQIKEPTLIYLIMLSLRKL